MGIGAGLWVMGTWSFLGRECMPSWTFNGIFNVVELICYYKMSGWTGVSFCLKELATNLAQNRHPAFNRDVHVACFWLLGCRDNS
jgi:hypothetical protein